MSNSFRSGLFALALLAATIGLSHAQSAAPQPASQASPRFDILEFVVLGNSVLDTASIERAVYPFMGEAKQFADVDGARRALEQAYQERGYLTVSVDVPQQQVAGGVVTLRVVEGEIDRLSVKGAQYTVPSKVRDGVPALQPGQVPNIRDAEAQLGALNRDYSNVSPGLKPGRAPGTVDVDLNVQDRLPLSGNIELNDQQAFNTERFRSIIGLRYANLWQANHQLGVQFLTAPQSVSQVRVWSTNYVWPLPDWNSTLVLYAVDSSSNTPSTIGGTTILGAQTIFGARLIRPFPTVRGIRNWMTLGLDYKNLRQQDFATLKYFPMSVAFNWQRPTSQRTTNAELLTVFSMRDVGNNPAAFADRRFGGDSSFVYLRFDTSHEEKLGDWTLRGRLAGQYTSQPLVQSEQFAVGGANSVRGYFEAETIGDRATLGSLELRSKRYSMGGDLSVSALGFVEGGRVHVELPLPGQTAQFNIASLGAGVRVQLTKRAAASLDIANTLRAGVFTASGSTRLHGRLTMDF